MLDHHPAAVRALSDVALVARRRMAHDVSPPDNLILEEALPRRAAEMQRELEGAHPSPLERLLCEHIATCWIAVSLLDAVSISTADGRPLPPASEEHHERMRSLAQRRYLAACESLAKVRRLLAPVMQQVNIAEAGAQQLNLAAPPAPAALPAGNAAQ